MRINRSMGKGEERKKN